MAGSKLSLPWGLNFCLQVSPPFIGLACQLFRIQMRFPRSDPSSKILYRFLTVRLAQCLSFGIRHSFELIATERNVKVVPFRIETRVASGNLRGIKHSHTYYILVLQRLM